MKIFNFKQDNNFGDRLEMTISAESEEQAKGLIRQYIVENTEPMEESYKSSVEYIKSSFSKELKNVQKYISECPSYGKDKDSIDREEQNMMNEEKFCSGIKCYSINEFLADEDRILQEFGDKDAKRTYSWTFDNEPYALYEVKSEEPKIISTTFVYCGR